MAHFFGGWVYLLHIETQKGHYYKIGKASKLDDRIKQIGLLVPFDVDVVAVMPCVDESNGEAEERWHEEFAEKRTRGEWFDLSGEDVKVFCDNANSDIWGAAMAGFVSGLEHPFVAEELKRKLPISEAVENDELFLGQSFRLVSCRPGIAFLVDEEGYIRRIGTELLIEFLQSALNLYSEDEINAYNKQREADDGRQVCAAVG